MERYLWDLFSIIIASAMLACSSSANASANAGSDEISSVAQRLGSAASIAGAANLPASANETIRRANDAMMVSLRPVSAVHAARVTFYDPDMQTKLEGGGLDRHQERVNSIEDAAINGRPVTLAADVYGTFGRECNRREKRCLLLILIPGFDGLFPQYRKRFAQLPKDSFIGIVEDTGGAFFGTHGSRFDLAARNRALARAIPSSLSDRVRWTQMENPCGPGSAGRTCNFSEAGVAPVALAMLNLPQ